MLVTDGGLLSPLCAAVIVVSSDLAKIGLVRLMLDPPVEIEETRLVAVDEFAGAKQPVLQKL